MPLRLYPPRTGKTPNYQIRGTYYGVRVDRSAGTPDRAKARKELKRVEADIECGAYAPKGALTFAGAAKAYILAGGETRFLEPILKHFGTTPVANISQADIDSAAATLYPKASAATRNRQVYSPVSAVLKHNSVKFELKRPKGASGETRVVWLWPEQVQALIAASHKLDPEFAIFVTLMVYCGPRLEEARNAKVDDLRLSEGFAFIGKTKNGDPRPIHLPPVVVAALGNHPDGLDRAGDRIFGFSRKRLYELLEAALQAAGIVLPPGTKFHAFRHTFGTWMRRYAGLDAKGLVATGVWRDEKSAARYQHVVVSEEAQRADLLPTPKSGNGK